LSIDNVASDGAEGTGVFGAGARACIPYHFPPLRKLEGPRYKLASHLFGQWLHVIGHAGPSRACTEHANCWYPALIYKRDVVHVLVEVIVQLARLTVVRANAHLTGTCDVVSVQFTVAELLPPG
jgi:hypothetical protein